MTSAVMQRDTLMPRPPAGMGPGLLLAIVVHLALILAIAYGVRWHASEPEGVEAELWAAVPQTAAPPVVQPPPAPEPAVKPPPPPPLPQAREEPDAQIAIEKAKREAERRKKEEAEKLAAKRKKEDADKLAEKLKQEQAHQLAEKRKHEQEEKRRIEREEAQRAELRRKNLERMMAQAGAGTPSSNGTAERTSGPSAGYAGRIKARIKPNIVYTGTPSANAAAEVEVRLAPDGTIVGQRLTKSSGSPDWDIAVQRAVERTQMLPRDVDGTVPSSMVISFRPLE